MVQDLEKAYFQRRYANSKQANKQTPGKDVQHHQCLGKCKSKQHGVDTSLTHYYVIIKKKKKKEQMIRFGEIETLSTAGENVEWFRQYGKEFCGSSDS